MAIRLADQRKNIQIGRWAAVTGTVDRHVRPTAGLSEISHTASPEERRQALNSSGGWGLWRILVRVLV